ncbi:MAG: type II toxin-antitoxin system RelE/ParE family toxin [Chloroflexota bacterium]|nr:type II toxin-antitoxin system RelE/ParE family toxin [Chloroflexota bacterium]
MTYKIILRQPAQKQLDRITGKDYEAIARTISALALEPRPKKVKKLAESGLWRIRVGQYRVVYNIDDGGKLVMVVRVIRRNEDTYKGL